MSQDMWIRSTAVVLVFCVLLLSLPSVGATRVLMPRECDQIRGGWVCAVLKVVWWVVVACTTTYTGWQVVRDTTNAIDHLSEAGNKCQCEDCVVRRQWQHVDGGCAATEVYEHTDNYYVVQ